MSKQKVSFMIRRQNDYLFSRWVLIVYKGTGNRKRIDTWHMTATKLGAEARKKAYQLIYFNRLEAAHE